MSGTVVIKINDARLAVAGDGRILHLEPGYAVVDEGRILTGAEAFALSRIKPRQMSNRHWSNLSAEAGSAGLPGGQSSAELAYTQLARIWTAHGGDADAAILVVPNDYSSQDLGLLLGLAQECGMPVVGMVDAAVGASVRPYPGRQLLYIDAGLYGVTVTPLEQSGEVSSLETSRLDTGLATLMDAFAHRVAELFVLETRFDPMHEAATEQMVYDGMLDWLDALRSLDSVPVKISWRGETFRIDLERTQLLGAAQGFYRALQQLVAQTRAGDKGLAIQLNDKLAVLPGIVDSLGRLDDALIVRHEPGHGALALLDAQGPGDGGAGQVRLYRHLPWRGEPVQESGTDQPQAEPIDPAVEPLPTHLVYRGIAYPVNGGSLLIGRTVTSGQRTIVIGEDSQGVSRSHCSVIVADGELRLTDLSSYGTFVNERRVDSDVALKPADVIRIGSPGAEITAIRVEDLTESTGGA